MKAVLWDFDGTVADTEVVWMREQGKLVADYGGEFTTEFAHSLTGTSMAVTASAIAEILPGHPLTAAEVSDRLERQVIATIASGPLPYRPGVAPLLAELAQQNFPCALVSTSSRQLLEIAVSKMPVHPFQLFIGGEDVTCPKPDPEGYLVAAQTLGVDPHDVLIVEDSFVGTLAAQASGAVVLVIPDQVRIGPAPHRVILDNLAGLSVNDLKELWRTNR